MDGWKRRVLKARICNLEDFANVVAAIGLLVMMASITISTVERYLLDSTTPGVVEATELYWMPAAALLPLALVQRHGGHVGLTIVTSRMPVRAQLASAVISGVVGLAFYALMTYDAVIRTMFVWGSSTVGDVAFPVGPSEALLVVGASLICLRLLYQVVGAVAGLLTGNTRSLMDGGTSLRSREEADQRGHYEDRRGE